MAKLRTPTVGFLFTVGIIFSLPHPANAASCDAFVTKWAWFIGGEVTVNPDGTFVQQSGNAGTWECTDPARGRITMRWRDGGFVNSLVVSPDGQNITSTDLSQSYVTARRSGPAPRTPVVRQENCCQEAFGCETKKIEAEFEQKMARCHFPGNSGCIAEATRTKASRLKAANEKLRSCNNRAANGGVIPPVPQTGGGALPPLPTSNDEFHSTEGTGGFAQECQPCGLGTDQTTDGGDTFGSNTPAQADCVPQPDPSTQVRLRKTGVEVLDTLAAMGQQADRAQTAMGKAITGQLAYYAQPNAKIWSDRNAAMKAGAKAIVDYLTNDNAKNHARLRQGAETAVRALMQDPAPYIGAAAVAILTGKAIALAGSICKGTPKQMNAAIEDAAKAEKAAERYEDVVKSQLELEKTVPNPCVSPVNPAGLQKACHTATWAEILTEETGFQWTAEHFKEVFGDLTTPWEQIYRVQKNQWGDRVFANHTPAQRLMQEMGIPARKMKGYEIVKELKDAGDGADGILTIQRSNGTAHTVRGSNINGEARFKEAGGGRVADFDPANSANIVQMMFYRVSGQDLIP